MRFWKVIGMAGIVGATAAGAVLGTRALQRERRRYREADPDELRSHLHARLAAANERAGDAS